MGTENTRLLVFAILVAVLVAACFFVFVSGGTLR
jgi:hypothetical protein